MLEVVTIALTSSVILVPLALSLQGALRKRQQADFQLRHAGRSIRVRRPEAFIPALITTKY